VKDELRFAAKHPWWVVGVVVVTFVIGTLLLAFLGVVSFIIAALIEWAILVLLFTYYYDQDARPDSTVDVDVDVEARAREEEL
jgi:hypothetical protein